MKVVLADIEEASLIKAEEELKAFKTDLLSAFCDLSNEPHSVAMKLDNPITIGNITNTHLYFKHFSYDPIISSSNRSVITSIIRTDYEYWKDLYKDIEMYKLKKERICAEFIKIIKKRFPETKG